MTNEYHDPRTESLTHDIKEGQVYGDTRHKPDEDEEWEEHALYRIVYVDEHVVLLKSNNWTERTNSRRYQQEPRDVFERYAGGNRFKLLEDSDKAPPMPDDLQEVRALVIRMRDHYANVGGRKNTHKHEAMVELLEKLEDMEPEKIDVESVPGVGKATAENLHKEGYDTDIAIEQANKEELVNIPGVGETVAERLIDRAT